MEAGIAGMEPELAAVAWMETELVEIQLEQAGLEPLPEVAEPGLAGTECELAAVTECEVAWMESELVEVQPEQAGIAVLEPGQAGIDVLEPGQAGVELEVLIELAQSMFYPVLHHVVLGSHLK